MAKMVCASMARRSRCCYKYFAHIVDGPSLKTLDNEMGKVIFDCGPSPLMASFLSIYASRATKLAKYIIFGWDEMSLIPHLQYDPKLDKIIGFTDWGHFRKREIADHALNFYIRILSTGDRMPVGYGFCLETTETPVLEACLKNWFRFFLDIGLYPVATVCDRGSTNVAAINRLVQKSNVNNEKPGTNDIKTCILIIMLIKFSE